MLTLAYLKAGQLHLAHQLSLEGLALVEQSGGHTWEAGYLQYVLFKGYYAWNQREEASEARQRMLRIAQNWHQVDLLSMAEQALVQLSLARGDLATAQQALQKLEALVEQEQFANHTFWLESARVQCWLAQGNLAEAFGWAAQTTVSPQSWNPHLHERQVLMLIRVSLAQQQYTQALELLSRFREQLDHPGDIVNTIRFLALSVLALHLAGKRTQAVHVAARLLALTEPQGYIRGYLDLGAPMKEVLLTLLAPANAHSEQAHYVAPRSRSFLTTLLAAFEHEERQRRTPLVTAPDQRRPLNEAEQHPAASSLLIEPLSQREQDVLCLLAEGASNQEIATTLVIQLSTVKKHVGNLLSKLGVARRSQAIARARALSLLPGDVVPTSCTTGTAT